MKKIFQWYLHAPLIWLNIGGFVLGCAAGLIVWKIGDAGYAHLASQITAVLAPFGNVLISMLKMIVIPIIFCSLVCGAASLPFRQFGRMGAAVVVWYLATSLYAALFGTFTAIVCNPTLKNSAALAARNPPTAKDVEYRLRILPIVRDMVTRIGLMPALPSARRRALREWPRGTAPLLIWKSILSRRAGQGTEWST